MKFDVVRASSHALGLDGVAAPCPIEGAVLNLEEKRWELDVATLEELMTLLSDKADGLMVLHGVEANGIGLLEIYDLEEDGCGEPDCLDCNPPAESGPHALS